LPGVTSKIQAALNAIEEDLKNIPDPPVNALFTVNNVLRDFSQTFARQIDGDTQPSDLSKAWKKIKEDFFEEIVHGQRPNLVVVEDPQQTPKRLQTASSSNIICLDSESDGNTPCPPGTPSKKRKGAWGPIATAFVSPATSNVGGKSTPGCKKRTRAEERK
jgi:hypothetical protein